MVGFSNTKQAIFFGFFNEISWRQHAIRCYCMSMQINIYIHLSKRNSTIPITAETPEITQKRITIFGSDQPIAWK